MGFRLRIRTSNNCLVLKTLIDKQFKENERLYFYFIDFSKAFDTVWRKGLLARIGSYRINGKILNVLRSLYLNTTTAHVKLGDAISDAIEIMLGVKQRDLPSPLFFNIYMNDLCTELLKSSDNSNMIELRDCTVPCLFWADDLVLISKTKEGPQELPNIFDKYSSDWKMKVNIEKPRLSFSINKDG